MTAPLTALTARRLLSGFAAGDFTPVDATRAALDRIGSVRPDAALAAAEASAGRWERGEPRGLLDGVPVAVEEPPAPYEGTGGGAGGGAEAPSAVLLREHGAVLVGRTPAREPAPRGPSRTPARDGAAAVALGAVPLSLGTDGGGAIRVAASFSGVLGLKPTYGRVPHFPAGPFGALAHVGPTARDAADAALMLDVISGPGRVRQETEDGVKGLRIAYSPSFGGQVAVHPSVASAVRGAVTALAGLGAYITEADPDMADPVDAFRTLWSASAARLAHRLGPGRRRSLDPALLEIAAAGARISAVEYLAAEEARAELERRMDRFHTSYDLLVTPTVPVPVTAAEASPGPRGRAGWPPFAYPFNMSRQPAASVPCGVDADGLPIGVQLIAARHADALVLRAAHALYEAGATAGAVGTAGR
ncbi:amidase family protein [Streptomyces amakusaensis]|uniref:Amidase family protein n=1 Tax=Streptomyces amakusaensis TaxID=67271 RepID=A0ABW0AF94_9ACTN